MTISAIEIKNVKGIDHKKFKLHLMPNKPNLLVAGNGFGKSSIATAFASMNSNRMNLANHDHYKENTAYLPELSIVSNGQTLTADNNRNEIRQQFDVTVIRSGLVSKATKRNMGGFTQATASLEIESIPIRKIPKEEALNYQVAVVRSTFGKNGKVLTNISSILRDPTLSEVIQGCNLTKLNGIRVQRSIRALVTQVNQQKGTAKQIRQKITDNLLEKVQTIAIFKQISDNLQRLNLVSSETEAFLAAYQISEIYKADNSSFRSAINWLQYIAEKNHYEVLIQTFNSSTWQWAKVTENRKGQVLSVVFPHANQLSNGQRDVLTLVVQMHKALYGGSSRPLILVVDEIFDYLDDANLVAFQHYVILLIQEYKRRNQIVYPLILTHLDPGLFFDFCFNNYKIHTHYLQAKPNGKSRDMLRLIEIREREDTEETIKELLERYWFHFHPDSHEIALPLWPTALKEGWRKSADFHVYGASELEHYLKERKYDALAVCIAVRVAIEKNVYYLLATEAQKQQYILTHTTRKKLNFAAAHIPEISETYFLLGLIHNANLHWKQGKDYVSPLVSKLNHPIIKNLVAELKRETAWES